MADQNHVYKDAQDEGGLLFFFLLIFPHVNWPLAIIRYDLVGLGACLQRINVHNSCSLRSVGRALLCLLIALIWVSAAYVYPISCLYSITCPCLVSKSCAKTKHHIRVGLGWTGQKKKACLYPIRSGAGAQTWYPVRAEIRLKYKAIFSPHIPCF